MLAKKRYISQMRDETEAYMYNISSMVSGFTPDCADAVMDLYPEMAEKAITQMTLIACEKHPEAFSQFVISNACSAFLLAPKNEEKVISGSSLTPLGTSLMDLFRTVLKRIADDPATPSGKHNTMMLDFVQKELARKMK